MRPAILGEATQAYREVLAVSIACFTDVCAALKPGATLGAVMAAADEAVARHGKGACKGSHPVMHARGLGDEYPAPLRPKDMETQGKIALQAGMVFVLKPRISRDDGIVAQIGDTVVVEAGGGRRLGRAKLALMEVPWG